MKLRKNSRNSNVSNINDDNDFRFLVTGGYRPENNELVKFLVSLRLGKTKVFGSNHNCGGSILTKKAILTAAHCQEMLNVGLVARALTVVVGTPRRLVKTENTQELKVEKLIRHPKWNPDLIINDIGIIKLKDEIRLDDNFASIIPLYSGDPTGLKCTVIGWGSIIAMGPVPDEVVNGNVTVNSREFCNSKSGLKRKDVICISDPNDNEIGGCHGDSGGPLICDGQVVGVASYIVGACGAPKTMSFYADVSYFHDWIIRNAACRLALEIPKDSASLRQVIN
ncbi:hypothetical protein ACLKA6_010362 [Drosophila palustris]